MWRVLYILATWDLIIVMDGSHFPAVVRIGYCNKKDINPY